MAPLTDAEMAEVIGDVLSVDGALLARHKMFTRSHLVAEIAPRLYGRDPADLEHVLDRITNSPDLVPLIRVDGARDQTYTTIDVLAAEQTIAQTVDTLAWQPGPTVPTPALVAAMNAKAQEIGQPLTAGQHAAVEAICAADSAVTVIVGVAGAGKTTALDAASCALEASGYRVLGTSTSGQAARTLGHEADIEARTFRSLLWRLDHEQITLDNRTVVVVDEAGMANDADLARLLLAAEHADAKLVIVGDHRQLAAIGPGGALAALLERGPELVVNMDDNVRQRDRAERQALAELRDGSVPSAVAWYAQAGRIATAETRTETLTAMTAAWSNDIANGHDAVLLAWRRADVRDLNRLARRVWDQLGRFHSDDVTVTNGHTYAVGDRVVALAPNHDAGVVTSEQLTVIDVASDRLAARRDDGRIVTLTRRRA